MNLITITDVRVYWPVSMNLDASRVDSHILRAQDGPFKTLLSPELYLALKDATIVAGDRFDKLMSGEKYKYGSNFDIEWEGAKKLLCAYAYANIVDANPIHIVRGGNVNKSTEQSTKAPDKNTSLTSREAYGEAIRLEREFQQWICQFQNVYPEYRGGRPAKEASVNFFNASRPIRYGFGYEEWKHRG